MKKRILALLISVLFIISLTGVFALDLSDYPSPFVVNGVYDNSNRFIVGSTAPPSDSIAVADIVSGLQFESKTCTTVNGEETCTVTDITPITRMDTEIAGSESSYNLVLIGSPCANKAIGRVSGTGITCETWSLTSGKCIIRLASNGNKVALVVAGEGEDTRKCGKVIRDYKNYALSGTTVIVTGNLPTYTVTPGSCGDGFCNPSSESYSSCSKDCLACMERWTCTDWSSCANSKQTRTCTESSTCGTTANKPSEVMSCCIEEWTCTDWGACDKIGSQKRTCTESNNCGTTYFKPEEGKSCVLECGNGVCSGLEIFFDIGESIEFGGKVVTLENVAEGGVLVDVDRVKESINLTKSKIVNELSIKVEDVYYHTTKAQRQAALRFGENEYSCPKDCLAGYKEEACVENWVCANWSSCINNQETRTCTDANNCGTTAKKPMITQNCTACTESWTCTDWSVCNNNQETRTCTDAKNCGTTVNKPVESRSCGCTPKWECEINPSTCPSDGLQTKVCKDTACGGEDTREVTKCEYIPPGQETKCDGCLLDSTCVSFGFRREEKYCDVSKNFYPQKKSGESCDNNFECATNTCSKGACIDLEKELKESMNVINKIWCKLLHPFSNERYTSCLIG